MWTISYPTFEDGHPDYPVPKDRQIVKPLLCGKTYVVGRKSQHITIARPFISREHGQFIVGEQSDSDVYDVNKIPSLEYMAPKAFKITRAGNSQTKVVAPNAKCLLRHGDAISVHNKIFMTPIIVSWNPIVCFLEDINMIRSRDCAQYGMKLCMEYNPAINYHIAEELTGEPTQLPIILHGGNIVNKSWAAALFKKLADTDGDPTRVFEALREDYLPCFSPNLKETHRQSDIWRASRQRLNLFKGHLFIFLREDNVPLTVWRNVIAAGGGDSDGFNVHDGTSRWITYLTHARSNAREQSVKLVVITDEIAMNAAVGDAWKEFIRETQRMGLRFLSTDLVVEAILQAKVDILRSEFDPGTDEPSATGIQQDGRSIRHGAVSRGTSVVSVPDREASVPQEIELNQEPPPRSRLLRRRVRQTSVDPMIGLDSPAGSSQMEPAANVPVLFAPSTSTNASSNGRAKLKRRNPTQHSQTPEPEIESALAKHRKLFEDTDPDRHFSSQYQGGNKDAGKSLAQMVEEADQERLKALEVAVSQSRKRKVQEVIGEEFEIQEEGTMVQEGTSLSGSRNRSASIAPPTKKRMASRNQPAILELVAEEQEGDFDDHMPQTETSQRLTMAQKEPDRDDNFLIALASIKKGKRKEDQFDRDFNSLRIAKPSAESRALDEMDIDQVVWDSLPKDMDLKGDFLVCIGSIVPRPSGEARRHKEGKPEWVGRPDFKKFKKKLPTKRSALVELVANLSVNQEELEEPADTNLTLDHDATMKAKGRPFHSQAIAFSEDDDFDDPDEQPNKAMSGRTRAASQQPLFMPDSDEDDLRAAKGEEETSSRVNAKAAASKRKAVVLAASSSEDEGYRKRRRRGK